MVKVGLIGLGTVGVGVVKILQKNKDLIEERVGDSLEISQFCDKFIKENPEIGLKPGQIVSDYKKLVEDPSLDILIELIGGYEPARTLIVQALESGKHVVTANKAVLAKHWDEIFLTAQKHGALVYFEAAVGGGIPIIQGLNEGLAANHIKKIVGILNGTTNFILTRMSEKNLTFQDALKQARDSGFAESDPTYDIEGTDSAHKLAILSSLAFGGWVKISDIHCEGITDLDILDIQLAQKEFGFGLKLLGIAKESNGKVEARVHPAFLPPNHPFLSVKDEYNAISIVGDVVSDVMFYGKGAGQMAAASAVVSDLIFLARQVSEGTAGKLPYVTVDKKRKVELLKREEFVSQYYLRFTTSDQPGVLAKISGLLGQQKVSIASVYQPAQEENQSQISEKSAHIVVTTHSAPEGQVLKAVREIDRLPFIKSKTTLIR
ncbi:MAG: homoserine dehydrogenase, partial [Elusimicrobia bacterium]|nr:homoserine dehydrogenase [Elusimicrobiota bacterium]